MVEEVKQGLYDKKTKKKKAAKKTSAALQDAIAVLDTGIEQIVGGIEGFRQKQLRDVLVNDERLIEVAKWCSQTGFNKDSADIPVSLFREVKHSAEEYTERSLTIREMNKGEFVESPMAQRASNEDEWFDRTVSSHVAGSVMADILKASRPEIVDVDIAEADRPRILSEYDEVGYANTNSKSVLGSMNDLAFHYKYNIPEAGGVHSHAIPEIIRRLNRMPMGAILYRISSDPA